MTNSAHKARIIKCKILHEYDDMDVTLACDDNHSQALKVIPLSKMFETKYWEFSRLDVIEKKKNPNMVILT